MPRDLEAEYETIASLPPLSSTTRHHHSSPADTLLGSNLSHLVASPETDEDEDFLMRESRRTCARNSIHPFSSPLTIGDIEDCVALENAAFPEEHRATRRKFDYRLRKCSNLSFALHTPYNPNTETPDTSPFATLKASAPTLPTASPVESADPDRKKLLIAHIVSTLSTNPTVQDEDMAVPDCRHAPTERDANHVEYIFPAEDADPRPGHKEEGRTICLHSLAVLPSFQGKGFGRTVLKAYIERMESAGAGDRIALLSLEDLVPFYEKCGFENRGPSRATFGGAKWFDMVKELQSQEEKIENVKGISKSRSAGKIFRDREKERQAASPPKNGVSER